jgi:CubicO group peptidase (beta-lactamase class C family)
MGAATVSRWLIVSATLLAAAPQSPASPAADPRIHRVEQGLLSPVLVQGEKNPGMSLRDRMRRWNVPGLSIAVIEHGSLAWARAYGATEAGGSDSVTTETLFQAGSVSKPVATMAALHLVESGRLGLDQDLNGYLATWKIPPSDSSLGIPITLRMILTHSAGFTVHGFPGYAASDSMPTLVQVLDGIPPANTPPIRVATRPGRSFSYSGGGFCVLQQALMDVAGKPYPEIVESSVLRPLGMTHSSYDQPRGLGADSRRASGHDRNGAMIPGRWHRYPELAPAGLWTTPSDLARLALEVEAAWMGRSHRVLSREMTRTMLTPQIEPNQGLGWRLAGQGRDARFEHSGDTDGFECAVVDYPERGQGAVVMTNGARGDRLAQEILRGIAKEYGWPDYLPEKKRTAAVADSMLRRYSGRYALDIAPNVLIDVSPHGDSLLVAVTQPSGTEQGYVEAESADRFFERESGLELTFLPRTADGKQSLIVREGSEEYRATRTP